MQASAKTMELKKITWAQAGRVEEPGRYQLKLGWLLVTKDDLQIWNSYPNAAFTLIKASSAPDADEFRLGTFELRTGCNYSDGER